MNQVNVLVVEDDEMTNTVICNFLEHEGYQATSASDGELGWQLFNKQSFSLIILDVMLPKMTGFELLKLIRETSSIPVILLTALEDEYSQIVGFTHQADDYVTKPFSPSVLMKRVESILRRTNTKQIQPNLPPQYGPLTIDLESKQISRAKFPVPLTKKELEIIHSLFLRINKITTREQLMDDAWDIDSFPHDRVIDSHIKNIRKKLPELNLQTIKGLGYLLEDFVNETSD